MLSLLGTAINGPVIGAVAKHLIPGKDPAEFIIAMLLGLAPPSASVVNPAG